VENGEQVACAALVAGDIVRFVPRRRRPRDCKLVEGDYISIDQSAAYGGIAAGHQRIGRDAYSGSVVKREKWSRGYRDRRKYISDERRDSGGAGNISHFRKP